MIIPSQQCNSTLKDTVFIRLDSTEYGGGITVYSMQEDIQSKLIPMQSSSIEGLFMKLNLRCKKWLLSCSYNSHRTFISEHISNIGQDLHLLIC